MEKPKREKLEISRKDDNILILKDLYYHGQPVEELDKEQLLIALQEITATAIRNKELADKNLEAYKSWASSGVKTSTCIATTPI